MEKTIARIALFTALIVVLGLLPKFNLASGVPITAQGLGVMLAGAILGARKGALAVLLFLLLIALGFPFLAGGRGGIGIFTTPSAGFLIGWVAAAFVIGLIMQSDKIGNLFLRGTIAAAIGGIIVMYAFGIPGMAITLDKSMVEATGFALPYIPGDLIKCALTGLVVQELYRRRPSAVTSLS